MISEKGLEPAIETRDQTSHWHNTLPVSLDDRERRFSGVHKEHFLPFYLASQQGTFTGKNDLVIDYRLFKHPDERASIVLLPGRTESHIKYAETIFDLYHAGFSVFTLDHRGQGFSGRLTQDSELGTVDSFDDYVADLHTFMTTVVATVQGQNLFFLGHSMGAAIGAMYIRMYQPPLRGVIFSSPMLRINLGAIPRVLVQAIVTLRCLLGLGNKPAMASTSKLDVETYGADLTRSSARLTHYRSLLRDNPNLRLGPPSNLWMRRAIEATNPLLAPAALHAIRVPVLLLEACADSVLRISANRRFEGIGSWMVRASFPDAYHDLFIETDEVRKKALTMMFLFLQENSKI